MSTAVVERVVEQPRTLDVVKAAPAAQPSATAAAFSDPSPLLPVFIAGALSLVLAGAFIGAILIWLAVRHGGIMAP